MERIATRDKTLAHKFVQAALNPVETVKPVSLPWPQLDYMVNQLRAGEITILAGSPGSAKTYFSLALYMHAMANRRACSYLPLEDTAAIYLRRCVTMISENWACMGPGPEALQREMSVILEDEEKRRRFTAAAVGIYENPTLAIREAYSDAYIPEVTWEHAIKWIGEEVDKGTELIIIDPISSLEFEGRGTANWKGQERFINAAKALVTNTDAHLLMVAHLAHRGGGRHDVTMDDIQGAKAFQRFAQNLLVLLGHEEKTSTVSVNLHQTQQVEHGRTVYIFKTRNGPGSNHRVVIDFRGGPVLCELGTVIRS